MELRIARMNGGEVLGSRGSPTVEIEVTPAKGIVGQALVPFLIEADPRSEMERAKPAPSRFAETRSSRNRL